MGRSGDLIVKFVTKCVNLLGHFHKRTTPDHFRHKLKMRSSSHRFFWAFSLAAIFFLLTVATQSSEDGSASNLGIGMYLMSAIFFALIGYFGGIYFSLWVKKLSPSNQLKSRSSRVSRSKKLGRDQ